MGFCKNLSNTHFLHTPMHRISHVENDRWWQKKQSSWNGRCWMNKKRKIFQINMGERYRWENHTEIYGNFFFLSLKLKIDKKMRKWEKVSSLWDEFSHQSLTVTCMLVERVWGKEFCVSEEKMREVQNEMGI